MSRVALLTGFEPYGGRGVNPATEVVTRLDGVEVEGARVAGRVLPVSFGALRSRIHELLREEEPEVVVSLGLWPGEATIRLERLALNLADFEIPDNDGALLRDDVVAAAGPTALAATLPLRARSSAPASQLGCRRRRARSSATRRCTPFSTRRRPSAARRAASSTCPTYPSRWRRSWRSCASSNSSSCTSAPTSPP